jgi:hypothetical protein
MQISTIHKLQHALDISKKVLKFVWRHALVLSSFAITIQVICEGHVPSLKGEIICFAIAFSFDWLKMQFKATKGNYNLAQEKMFESSKWSRPTQMGSAWDSYDPGSPAYYIRQDRYC